MGRAPAACLLSCFALAAGLCDSQSATAAERVRLHPCGAVPEPPGFRCGSIRVPFERADPSYGTTRIAFAVRTRDRDNRPSLGTIFAQEGGPGVASTGTANAYVHLFQNLLRRRDLVVVDMRGTGRSERIKCPELQHGLGPEWITLAECARQLGKRFVSYRTSAGADDLNAVRKALGLNRITLYGDSYGTYLAQSYAYRHGETLRALVLDSAYPAKGESPWYGSLIRTGVRSLRLACRRSPDCSGDVVGRLYTLARFLRRKGWTVEPLIRGLGRSTYGTPESYLDLDRAGRLLRRGRDKPWNRETRLYSRVTSGDPLEYARGSELAVSCNDYPMIWEKTSSESERRRELERAIRRHAHNLGPFRPREIALSEYQGYLQCLNWPAPTAVYEQPISPDDEPTRAPVLVVSGEMDNLTTPQEGRWTADLFPRSRLFVARNAGHVDSLIHHDGAAAKTIRRFLRRH